MMELEFAQWQNHVMIDLPSSKSISNRVLMIQKMCDSAFQIQNLSTAHDTFLLKNILDKKEIPNEINAEDAGTAYRFLTAWLAFQNKETILTGTKRMHERPIGALVSALRQLGANIEYIGKEGFPPLRFHPAQCTQHKIKIQGNISSQYISALLLIAPTLPFGLELELVPPVLSEDYIHTTLQVMRYFGIDISQENNFYKIKPQKYFAKNFHVESDWSGAAFFYAWLCREDILSITLNNLSPQASIHQADSAILKWATDFFQIKSQSTVGGILITKDHNLPLVKEMTIPILHSPDLAPVLVVLAVLHKSRLHLTGTRHLHAKESDRAKVLQKELLQLHVHMTIEADDVWIDATEARFPEEATFHTYDDHRIAMALAALHTRIPKVHIIEPDCVQKSFPDYWLQIKKMAL